MSTESTSTVRRLARIAAGDDGTTCDTFSIALHWPTAVLVLLQLVFAATWEWLGRPAERLMPGQGFAIRLRRLAH